MVQLVAVLAVAQLPTVDPVEFAERTVPAPLVESGHLEASAAVHSVLVSELRSRSRTMDTAQVFSVALAIATGPVDPLLQLALIRVESAYNHLITSPVGAEGLTQLMPPTAAETALRHRLDWVGHSFDPMWNVVVGGLYLAQLLEEFNDNEELALTAYNRGPRATRYIVGAYGELPDFIREFYSDKVLSERARLRDLYNEVW